MSKKIIAVIAGLVVVSGGSFYAGTSYSAAVNGRNSRNASFSSLSPEDRQARFGQTGGVVRAGRNANGGLVSGEVLSKDASSITVKLAAGGSKIVFLPASATVTKSVSGSSDDIETGQRVMVAGTANPDGSITGETIQIRPAQSQ